MKKTKQPKYQLTFIDYDGSTTIVGRTNKDFYLLTRRITKRLNPTIKGLKKLGFEIYRRQCLFPMNTKGKYVQTCIMVHPTLGTRYRYQYIINNINK